MKTTAKLLAAAGILAALGTAASAQTYVQEPMYGTARSTTVEVAPAPGVTVYQGRAATVVEPAYVEQRREYWIEQPNGTRNFAVGYNDSGWGEDFGGYARR